MGNTFPLSGGGVDAVEGVFGDGRAPAVRRSAAGRRSDERGLSRVQHFAQDRLQDLRPHMAAIRRRQEREKVVAVPGSHRTPRWSKGDSNSRSLSRRGRFFSRGRGGQRSSRVAPNGRFFLRGTSGSNPCTL